MLEIHNLTLNLAQRTGDQALLNQVSFNVPCGHLLAIVGPSGCGKTTLLKTIAGLKEQSSGEIIWQERNLVHEQDFHPSELGYVPQFGVAHELLTVHECVLSAVRLRTCQESDERAHVKVAEILHQTGLNPLSDRPFKVLSGGQKRRLALSLELVTDPILLLCDEVTSGLDPKSEREITQLLHDLARGHADRIVINVTHSLANLSLYDTVLVMHEGHVVYHGPPKALNHYFSVESAEDIYPRLARRTAERWAESWNRHRDAYYRTYELTQFEVENPAPKEGSKLKLPTPENPDEEIFKENADLQDLVPSTLNGDLKRQPYLPITQELPSMLAQTKELLSRRWKIFKRDRGQLWLHLLMLFGFPLLVLIFGFEGIPQVRAISQYQEQNILLDLRQQIVHKDSLMKAGGLISGLVLMQVVLVTLMASNHSAREIAAERDILEREKLGGLRCSSYVLSKVLFLGVFVLTQAIWMGLFVNMFTPGIPGALMTKLLMLIMASAAMTFVCLGISAMMRSPEKATILSIYLVGFQLPLSGAVLALPKTFEPLIQPLIAAYWSWSGTLNSMKSSTLYDAVRVVTNTHLSDPLIATFVLSIHVILGLILTYVGTKRSQWD